MIEIFLFVILEVVFEGFLYGLPALFRRRLPGRANIARWIAIGAFCLLVLCWWGARSLANANPQETPLELFLGISGWVMIATFITSTCWCGFATSIETTDGVVPKRASRKRIGRKGTQRTATARVNSSQSA